MVLGLLKKVFGSKNDREIKRIQIFVDQINSLEPSVQSLSEPQLKAKTAEFKEKLKNLKTKLEN